MMAQLPKRSGWIAVILALSIVCSAVHAADEPRTGTFRRAIEVVWDAEHGTGDELAWCEFYTAGHMDPSGSDLRVTTSGGTIVPYRLLMTGPGDRVRIMFALTKLERKYLVFFGNTTSMQPSRFIEDNVVPKFGLLMEMRQFPGGAVENFEQVLACWERAQKSTLIGRGMIASPFVGFNPFGEQQQTISKSMGSIFAPQEGEYMFAGSADDRAALYIDGQPALFVPGWVGDIRYNAKVTLKRGRHDFVLYHVNAGGEGRFSIGWKPPNVAAVAVITRESFGISTRANPGPLEEMQKTLTADFKADYLGECFFENHYSHRYRFTAIAPKASGADFEARWDFGDGQIVNGKNVEHVFLSDGVYPILLTMKIGANTDAQTIQFPVSRDMEHIENPPLDEAPIHSKIVASYDPKTLPVAWLAWATWLHVKAGQAEPRFGMDPKVTTIWITPIAERLCAQTTLPDPDAALNALVAATRDAFKVGNGKDLLAAWDKVPAESNLQPKAMRQYANFLLWWAGDFDTAVRVLEPFAVREKDDGGEPVAGAAGLRDSTGLRRLYGQALILNGNPAEGVKILKGLTPQSEIGKQVVMSGALARTIEHYIDEKDWEFGDDFWERWQTRYPADFLEGYSVLLKTRLITVRNQPAVAAKVAEAFARAMPGSSYAPTLLNDASKQLAPLDAKKSAELKELLKKQYPEDPLSQ